MSPLSSGFCSNPHDRKWGWREILGLSLPSFLLHVVQQRRTFSETDRRSGRVFSNPALGVQGAGLLTPALEVGLSEEDGSCLTAPRPICGSVMNLLVL